MLIITDSAVQQLRVLVAENAESPERAGLRISIDKGGCSGLQYEMSFDESKPGDEITERDGVRVIVDNASLAFLNGATIDYCNDLTGTGFRVMNPNARRTCGCGTSFEPATAEATVPST